MKGLVLALINIGLLHVLAVGLQAVGAGFVASSAKFPMIFSLMNENVLHSLQLDRLCIDVHRSASC